MTGLSVFGIVAMAFGVLTVISGGAALFGGEAARLAVGNAVPFVLWFNFFAGFAYIVAGFALVKCLPWGGRLALALAALTIAVFAAFGVAVWRGAAFEMRTVGAMALRSVFWSVAAALACRTLNCFNPVDRGG